MSASFPTMTSVVEPADRLRSAISQSLHALQALACRFESHREEHHVRLPLLSLHLLHWAGAVGAVTRSGQHAGPSSSLSERSSQQIASAISRLEGLQRSVERFPTHTAEETQHQTASGDGTYPDCPNEATSALVKRISALTTTQFERPNVERAKAVLTSEASFERIYRRPYLAYIRSAAPVIYQSALRHGLGSILLDARCCAA